MSISFFPAGHQTLDDPNFHNAGAVEVLGLLGYQGDPQDPFGREQDPELFLGRALIASALVDASTTDTVGLPAIQEGRTTQGGRSPGRMAGRLWELVELGLRAQQLKVPIVWG